MSKLTLDEILSGPDELGILVDDSPQTAMTTVDDRTRSGFEEINAFVAEHRREPTLSETSDIKQKSLAKRLARIREDASLTAALKANDPHNLLTPSPSNQPGTPPPAAPRSLDEILDILGNDEDEGDIFTLRHVKPASEIDKADYTAQRQPCRDFDKYKPLFDKVSKELELGIRKAVEFKNEQEIAAGQFFILNGIMVYIAEVGEPYMKNGKKNARLKTIFANGTQGENLLRSLATELYKDPNGRRITDPSPGVLFGGDPTSTDVGTGTIYVLRSLSKDPNIAQHKNILHKIGVTSSPVKQRIANAENDSTYLLAPVEIVAGNAPCSVELYEASLP